MGNDMLRDVMQRMTKDLTNNDDGFFLGARGDRKDELEQLFPFDYDGLSGSDTDNNNDLQTSLRDQEFLHHSSLWGGQYLGGNGETKQRLKPQGLLTNHHQEIKTDGTLPAYCNPPNPCPYRYTAEMGCLEQFENTASFSRRYQAAQDCMCDTEHMFECPNPGLDEDDDHDENHLDDGLNDIEFDRFIQRTMQMNPAFQHKNLVAKKYNQTPRRNPFLVGEKLPIAAKKGNHVVY